jgi:hypothetical protein
MGTNKVTFVGDRRGFDHCACLTGSHQNSRDRKLRGRKRTCPEPEVWYAHAQPEVQQYSLSGAFSPEVTEVTSPESALTRSDRVRMHNVYPSFLLTIVIVQ